MHAHTHTYKINTISFITEKENITLSTLFKNLLCSFIFCDKGVKGL